MSHGLFAGVQIFIPRENEGNGSENWVRLVEHLLAKCKQTEMGSSPTTRAAASKNNPVAQQLRFQSIKTHLHLQYILQRKGILTFRLWTFCLLCHNEQCVMGYTDPLQFKWCVWFGLLFQYWYNYYRPRQIQNKPTCVCTVKRHVQYISVAGPTADSACINTSSIKAEG